MNELISVKEWIEKHSFDQEDAFGFLAGKILDGAPIESVDTEVSEAALNSYLTYVRATQKKKTDFTASVSKIVDPEVLARIQKSMREKAERARRHRSGLDTSMINILSMEDIELKNKLIEAAKQSKAGEDGYILMSEYAQALKKIGVEWDNDFRLFLERHSYIIEFKSNAPFNAQAIKIKDKPEYNLINIMEEPENMDSLEHIIEGADKICMDASSLMAPSIDVLFGKINPILKKHGKKIIVRLAVELELKSIAKNEKYVFRRRTEAKKGLETLYPEINEIDIEGEEGESKRTASQTLKGIFEKYRHDCKMLLISQDYRLSNEILNLNDSEAQGKKCSVFRISKNGDLYEFK